MPSLKELFGKEKANINDPKIQEFAKTIGVTKIIQGKLKNTSAEGIHIGNSIYRNLASKTSDRYAQDALESWLRHDIGLADEYIPAALKALVEEGAEHAYIQPHAGKDALIHEILHTFVEKYTEEGIHANMQYHIKEEVIMKFAKLLGKEGFYKTNLDWIKRPNEFNTELMTHYFLGNLPRDGNEFQVVAENFLRNAGDPKIAKLIGTSLGMAFIIKENQKGTD